MVSLGVFCGGKKNASLSEDIQKRTSFKALKYREFIDYGTNMIMAVNLT
ncbi:18517_t:CDS:2 [Racocetra fulgida]|uniref:18517_t:CDS:1 n=1 Tax=Racocetra fulgida TaxID=60492 RepID=A0A9N8YUT6_9GLOM|nr:18517_t:CDS:2 [Racocetra fulgida]